MAKGASDVRVGVGDVTKEDACKRFVDETIEEHGRGRNILGPCIRDPDPFCTATFATHRGKILVIASVASWLPYPRQIIYNSAMAAAFAFFDTLRVEVGDAIGITVVMPGWTASEITPGKVIHQGSDVCTDQTKRDMHVGPVPVAPVTECASAAVKGVLRGSHYVTVPFYYSVFLLYRAFAPEVLMWAFRLVYVMNPDKPLSKRVLEATQAHKILYPASFQK